MTGCTRKGKPVWRMPVGWRFLQRNGALYLTKRIFPLKVGARLPKHQPAGRAAADWRLPLDSDLGVFFDVCFEPNVPDSAGGFNVRLWYELKPKRSV